MRPSSPYNTPARSTTARRVISRLKNASLFSLSTWARRPSDEPCKTSRRAKPSKNWNSAPIRPSTTEQVSRARSARWLEISLIMELRAKTTNILPWTRPDTNASSPNTSASLVRRDRKPTFLWPDACGVEDVSSADEPYPISHSLGIMM